MESSDKSLSDLVDIVKSWIPRKSEAANVSRDFWMPDNSCRVCYDCDSQFNVFNRRHHCRLCGRVFCAKCTANSIPVSIDDRHGYRDEGDRIRVCNFCFKQWQQEVAPTDNGPQLPSPLLSPSLSTISLASSKTNSTGNSSTTVAASTSHSGAYQRFPYGSSTCQTLLPIHNGSYSDKQDVRIPERHMDPVADMADPSHSQYDFCMNRSEDEDDEYGACHSDSETQAFELSNDYYGSVDFDEVDHGYQSDKVHPAEENIDCKEMCSPVRDTTESHAPLGVGKTAEEAGRDNNYGCDASSSIYGIQCKEAEAVNFENNEQIWDPPEPEDEEDDREAVLFDEDDDENATGEWGYLRSSNSFGSGEYRCRDRSSEEHKKAMKNVVDGHFRALVTQLLQVENIPVGEEDDKENWLEIITSLSWEAATLLKPDTSKGGGMDPGGYVKVKCIACGRRSESMVVKGVVCKKNVAHRRMQSKIVKPRLLILGGALEYQRVTNLLSSFDTLLQQEMDHLKMAVAKIDAHHPNVLLVEKSVSRYAQDYLLAKNISLVLNIKRPLLERISRCTGAQIVPSIDHLSSPKLGCCDFFHVEKFLEEHGSAGQDGKKMLKTLMFFDGCPKPLGCTILLKGANGDELKKIKHVVQYGIFAAYHLALETSFLADEGASLPEFPLKSLITVALPDKSSSIDRSISTIPGFTVPAAGKLGPPNDVKRPNKSDAMLTSCNFDKMGISTSPYASGNSSSKCMGPGITTSPLIDMEKFCVNNQHKGGVEPHNVVSFSSLSMPMTLSVPSPNFDKVGFVDCHESGTFGSPDQMLVDKPVAPISGGGSLESLGEHNAVAGDAQIDSKEGIKKQACSTDSGASNQISNQRDEQSLSKEEFPPSPSEHQSILVSLSIRCLWKETVCERAHLFRIKYYGRFDKPLGRFLRDHLFDQNYRCRSCDMPSEAHVHCYTHRQGSLTISVRKNLEFLLPGERDGKIWMWHRCLRCPRVNGLPPATRRVVMSDAAWGLSFGKFLELSFSNHAAASRVASCGHSLHRDCLRFYGLGRMVACFRYAPINLHSVYLPPSKLDFNCQHHEWMQKEENEVADIAELLFTEVLNALRQVEERKHGSFNGGIKVSVSRRHIVELEGILQKEKAEFEELFQNTVKKGLNGNSVIDILELNKLRRQLLFQSYLWDQRLILAYSPENRPHELISSVMIIKKKMCSTEKLVDLSPAPKPLSRFTSSDAVTRSEGSSSFAEQEGLIDHHNHPNLSEQERDIDEDMFHGNQNRTNLSTSTSAGEQLDPLEYDHAMRRVLSDGQVPIMANLSDTLDAKWIGENGTTLVDASMANSAISPEATTVGSSISYDVEEQNGSPSRVSVPPRSADMDDLSSLIRLPFMSFYHCVNKNWGTSIRLDALNEYNPVYIFLFQELVRQGGARLLLPVGINNAVIPIFDEEPTSIISYALISRDYHFQMLDEQERTKDGLDSSISLPVNNSASGHAYQSVDEMSTEFLKSLGSIDEIILPFSGSRSSLILDPLTYTKALHVRVSFADEGPLGKVKYSVTCYYSKLFDALRRICCPSELDFVRSLSRCKKWGAQGGKSNVFFAKSLDDRFIIKQVTKTELESFIKFAPEYFKYLSESIATGSPTCLAKILGIYQVTSKNLKSGKESRMDVLVMENLLFGRNVTKLYDLKGSSRSRYNSGANGNNKVLLDQNLIEAMPTSPIFVGSKAKRLLERAVWNDTNFLASIDVMDYSLLVGVDEEKHELVLGIIDFMRQYTWDKHLETWVKASGILGGSKNESPTVISPMQYKKRFRKAMSGYFLVVPDQWLPPTFIPCQSQSALNEDISPSASIES